MAMIPFSVTTTGNAGSATGTATIPNCYGYVHYVKIDYHASAPATTTVVITENGGATRDIVNLSAGNTDKALYPVVQSTANTGTGGAITGVYQKLFISGTALTVTVALSDALTGAVTGFIQVENFP